MCEGALEYTRINGKPLESMDCVILKPNDRICIGPSAFFLFKNKADEENASLPDPDDDPITFDDASEEIVKYDTKIEEEEQ